MTGREDDLDLFLLLVPKDPLLGGEEEVVIEGWEIYHLADKLGIHHTVNPAFLTLRLRIQRLYQHTSGSAVRTSLI